MGGKQSKVNILVGTLNFSGICLSPFQYHDCSVQKDFMSSKFQVIARQYIKDEKFMWDVGKIDQKLQKERYTPVYRKDVCVGPDSKLMTRGEFQSEWKQAFSHSKQLVDKAPTADQISQAMLFDWIAYQTFLNIVYNQSKQAIFNLQKVKVTNPKPFVEFLQNWHSKPYLNNATKMKKVKSLIESHHLDVLCLQQAEVKEKMTWRQVISKQYQVVTREGTESILIYKTQKFPGEVDHQFQKKYAKALNFNDDSIFVKIGNYLLISGHLSSKSEKNGDQAIKMFQSFISISKEHKGIQIILGIDSNHFMCPDKFTDFNISPGVQTQSTTIKKRTAIQLQTKKTNVIVMETKDQIVSSLPVLKSHTVMIDGKNFTDKTYLPCESHPFDHFLVWAELVVHQPKK